VQELLLTFMEARDCSLAFHFCFNMIFTSSAGAGAVAMYCDEHVCVSMSVCPQGYLRNHTRYVYLMFNACCLWPWLGPLPAWCVTTLEKLIEHGLGLNTEVLAPRARPQATLGAGAGVGRSLPLWGSGFITHGKFLETQMLNPAFW